MTGVDNVGVGHHRHGCSPGPRRRCLALGSLITPVATTLNLALVAALFLALFATL